MKILHILDHSIPLHSGYTFRSRAILDQQRKMGWETVHITSTKHTADSPDKEMVDGLFFYRTRTSGGLLGKLPLLNQFEVVSTLTKRLDHVIEIEKPDILHAHSPSLNGMAALRAGKKHTIPVVYECRAFWEDAAVDHGTCKEDGARYKLSRFLETRVFQQADAVTTICDGLKRDIIARGVPEKKITVIPNAVDIGRFTMDVKPDPEKMAELDLEGKTVLGFIGSFYAYEGLVHLVRAMPNILKSAPDTRLLLVGGGPQEQEIRKWVDQLNLHEIVKFTGRVPHDEVAGYYNLVDIFVYPRLNMRLTELVTPLKPLEAMAQGKLVLASDVGGHRELIRDRENGCLFSAGSIESLSTAVLDMMEHRNIWTILKENGRKYVEEERNWPTSVSNYHKVYGQLLNIPLHD